MAETTALTKEAVAEARAQLIARDRKPSQRAIIKHLGRGSFSQIGPWLRELDAEEGEKTGSQLAEPLSEAVSNATAELWRALGAEADRVVEEARQGFERRTLAAEGERDRTQTSVERLRQELQAARLLGETQREQLTTQSAELDASRSAHASETAAHAETRGRAEGLAALAAERQAALEQLQRERDELRREWSSEREMAAAKIVSLTNAYEQQLAERDNQLAARNERIESVRGELSQSRLAGARLETSVERLESRLQEHETQKVDWQTQQQSLMDALAQLQAQFAALNEAKLAADQALMNAGDVQAQRLADKERLIDRLEQALAQREGETNREGDETSGITPINQ